MSAQMARISSAFAELEAVPVAPAAPAPQAPNWPAPPMPHWPPPAPPMPYWPPPSPPAHRPTPPPAPVVAPRDPDRGWIGKALAVAGVAVTLIGVVLFLVLAAQAGLLRPELRVGAGVALAAALVAVGSRLQARPGGRVGAIALSATGIAAAYLDIIAVTTIYHWVPPVAALALGAVVGGGGLALARRWDSQNLALLVLVPLAVLAPVITDGATLLLIGFMLVLSASALPVHIGRDWPWMHAARTAAVTLPLLIALMAAHFGASENTWLLGAACGLAALLAVGGALLLVRSTTHHLATALVTVLGVVPLLCAGIAVDRLLAALLAAALSAGLLSMVLLGDRLGVDGVLARVWSALSAVAALLAITVGLRGDVAAPALLALAVVVAVAGRHDVVARWAATGLGAVGGLMYLDQAPPDTLTYATTLPVPAAMSALACSVLLAVWAIALAGAWSRRRADSPERRAMWAGAGAVAVYCVTSFTVTAGVLVGGPETGFLAGQMAATICWIGLAAALFSAALRTGEPARRASAVAAGLVLTAAAMAKLLLFDLGTLDGMFRVVVFIVVGLVLLAMGTGYARSLAATRGGGDAEVRPG